MTLQCKYCERTFNSEEGLHSHTKAKHSDMGSPLMTPKMKKKMRNWAIVILVIILAVWIGAKVLEGPMRLPPTDMAGHIEESPESHVLNVPMQIAVQKHMLEHADGSGPGAAIINYNCRAFECEEGMVEKLEAFATKYSTFVYIAPYYDMDVKIALTRSGKITVLDEFDAAKIDAFIRATARRG